MKHKRLDVYKRQIALGILQTGMTAVILPRKNECNLCCNPVSYTHLDVYKRQVVGHDASEKNRVFQEVAWIGNDLEKLSSQILRTCKRAKVAIIMDWEKWWALSDAQAISRKFDYTEELLK